MPPARSIPPPPPPASDPDGDRGSRLMRFGAAVSAIVLSAIIATMPAAVRIAPVVASSCRAPAVWIGLLGVAFVPLAITTVALRHAVAAARLFDPRTVSTAVATALLWGATTFVVLAGFGVVLRATTHHHGLAGVTFAIVATVGATLIALFAARFVAWCGAVSPAVRWAAIAVASLAMGVGLAFFARQLGRSDAGSVFFVDALAFIFAVAFGAGAFPHRSRPFPPLALAGPPLAVIVLVVGLGTLRGSPILRTAIAENAPVLAAGMSLSGLAAGVPVTPR